LDHVAGQPGVLADDDPMAVLAAQKDHARGLAHLEGKLRGDDPIGAAPDTVGAKILTTHVPAPLRLARVGPDTARPHHRPIPCPKSSQNVWQGYGFRSPRLWRATQRRGWPGQARP